ncbi:WAT1-related protein [Trifolium repens]|nr:WAT1-related protein [Trifolium repens]
MDRRYYYKDLVPFVVLVANECIITGVNTLFKAATLQGMSKYVFVTYSYAFATIFFFPGYLYHIRSRVVPQLSFSILSKIAILGVIGGSAQIMGYAGISYSSPTLSSAIGNLIPAFTFMLAAICRMEKIAIKTRTTQAKVWGSIISISGGFIVTFYKGKSITNIAHNSSSFHLQHSNGIVTSVDINWVIGGLLLTVSNILITIWFIVQAEIMKEIPDELTSVFFHNLFAAILALCVGLLAETNSSLWNIRLDISLISIVCTAIFGKFLGNAIYAWAIHLKGPVYVTMFKPLSIVIAVVMGMVFLGDILHIGSIVGATIISIGLYVVLWGKALEEIEEDVGTLESPSTENSPLLQSYRTDQTFEKKTDRNVKKHGHQIEIQS